MYRYRYNNNNNDNTDTQSIQTLNNRSAYTNTLVVHSSMNGYDTPSNKPHLHSPFGPPTS